MKTGKTLTELAVELDRQANVKRDFLAPTTAMTVKTEEKATIVTLEGAGDFPLTENCHDQFASRLDIPKKYYDKMRASASPLLDENINHWLKAQEKQNMLRTLDGNARALLSNRYRPLDNFDLLQVALPVITKAGCRIESCEVTERRLYIKAVTDRLEFKCVGDVVQAGIIISNSEIGDGRLMIDPLLFKLGCLNGMIINDAQMKRTHIGKGHDALEQAQEYFRDSTREADDRAFWMKVQDVIMASFDSVMFQRHVDAFNAAHNDKISSEPVKVVEVAQKRFNFTEGENNGILKYLFRDGDLSRYGLANAITRMAQDVDSYDRSTDLERIGGRIIELPKQDWELINREAA